MEGVGVCRHGGIFSLVVSCKKASLGQCTHSMDAYGTYCDAAFYDDTLALVACSEKHELV